MKQEIVACPVHGDNETTSYSPDCRPYKMLHTVAVGDKWHKKGTCSQCDNVRLMMQEKQDWLEK